ncbi:hypothetical protein LEN26_002160 [Aphanomyces euteiches]|nr:hypothetical protein LEN26_002160 [Aphanomyces euteiches]
MCMSVVDLDTLSLVPVTVLEQILAEWMFYSNEQFLVPFSIASSQDMSGVDHCTSICRNKNSRCDSSTVQAPVGSSTAMTDLPPHLVASNDRINAALELAFDEPPPATGTLRVCLATEEEWNAFVDWDGEVVHLKYLEWFADSGEIHIIEFVSTPHEIYSDELNDLFHTRNIERWLNSYLSAKNSQGPRTCPDLSYGPHPRTPGAVLPPEIPIFTDFRTIKIEIGVSQSWGMAPGQLDHKAIEIWAARRGVEYVLCVKLDPDFANAEYKLYDVRVRPLVQLPPLPIAAPRTVVEFNGRRVLGIPHGMPLPVGFPKALSVDLYSALRSARKRFI